MNRQAVRGRFCLCAGVSAGFLSVAVITASATADSPRTIRYPRVYGATGHLYGPTQAHYQYQRQYGQPWHGYGGQTLRVSGHRSRRSGTFPLLFSSGISYSAPLLTAYGVSPYGLYVSNGCGYGGVVAGTVSYGPFYSTIPMAPIVMQGYPLWMGASPFRNEVLQQAQQENRQRWLQPLQLSPATSPPQHRPNPSTTAAKTKSRLEQARGDAFLRRQDYHKAYQRYRTALQTAPDRAEPFFRIGFTLVAIGYFDKAADYFKRGLLLDPQWPVAGESLGRIFGRNNEIAVTGIIGNATRWAKEDIRDPDRLFVLGVLLHFDNQIEKAHLLFEAAYRLAGGGEHLRAFLTSPLYANRTLPTRKTEDASARYLKKAGGNTPSGTPAGRNGISPATAGSARNARGSTFPPASVPSGPRRHVRLKPPVPPFEDQTQNPRHSLVPPLPAP